MTAVGRIGAATVAAGKSFLRRRTAVFFTFFFPVIIILIFGALVQTGGGGTGLFTEPAAYYVPGYLAVVVLFTPLSRVGSEVARHREGNQFEKLATTPLSRSEWLLAQTLVNVVVIGLAGLLLLGLIVVVTGADISFSPLLIPFVFLGVALFCGGGALIGSFAGSQDGVIAASNGIALPLLFLSETFVPPSMLPEWFRPAILLSPLTYFSRGVRAATYGPGIEPLAGLPTGWPFYLGVLAGLTLVFFAGGAAALPRTD
ncbi:ABC transporter permease [Halorientalis regularis]|jgi:ABC-2 type transport system permease protein|uniref:ABC-2 type transport system permease protein n=1 Tax=Halorientalis regularis TaxID=660518 RepID=A0A1G7FQ68_9EURY|nr:ABC transporter permease [Halorientalis regularis]SDE77909.1 ABC-2 type transport system permease protein [Halorientalis regularis]